MAVAPPNPPHAPSLLYNAVLANNEAAVGERLLAGDSQKIPASHMNCRDVIFRQCLNTDPNRVEEVQCKDRIYTRLVQAKLDTVIRKLTAEGDALGDSEPVARSIFAGLLTLETQSKFLMEQKQFRREISESGNTIYSSTVSDSFILKDKFGEIEYLCETEAFVYQLAWKMRLQNSFIPTRKIWIEHPEKDPEMWPYFKVALQPFLDPHRYLPFSLCLDQGVSRECMMKALLVEVFFGLKDSVGSNLRYDRISHEIVHIDTKDSLITTNGFDEDLFPLFYSELFALPQCHAILDKNNIDFIKQGIGHLQHFFPYASGYFNTRFAKMSAKARACDVADAEEMSAIFELQTAKYRAWEKRLTDMQTAALELERGNIKTMFDFVLFCFPGKKTCVYASYGLAAIFLRSQLVADPHHLLPISLRSILEQYVNYGVPYEIFNQFQLLTQRHLSLTDFLQDCISLPMFQQQDPAVSQRIYAANLPQIFKVDPN